MSNIRLGIAPIAWTNDDLPELGKENSFEQCISEMALAGFIGTEIGNKYPRDPAILHGHLNIRNLSVASAWFSSFLTTEPFEKTAEAFIQHRDFLHAMGAKVIVVSEQGRSIQGLDLPIIKDKPVFTEAEWMLLTKGLEQLGELAGQKNMSIVYHHHMGTGIQTTAEINRLMAETDPTKVSLLYDTGHLVFSGEDPLAVYHKHAHRIKHIHFKDLREKVAIDVAKNQRSFLDAVRAGVFMVPGDGDIDFLPIVKAIDASNYTGWVVVEAEQDPAIANPLEYAIKARTYLKEIWGI